MIKAIETVYNGYRFRSRLEARWAVFFDALGIKYEYEPEGFDLGEAGYYLPDFFIPETRFFYEVKPRIDFVSAQDNEKVNALDMNPPRYADGASFLIGAPITPEYTTYYLVLKLPENSTAHFIHRFSRKFNVSILEGAILKARQARFEHGEKPNLVR